MALDKKTFWARSISAVFFVLVMLAAIIYSAWSFLVLFAVVQFMALREYSFLLERIYKTTFLRKDIFAFLVAGFCAYIFLALFPLKNCAFEYSIIEMPMLFYFLGIFLGMALLLFLSKDKNAKMLLTGIGYIAIPLALLYHLRVQSLMIPLFLIVMIWVNDTMAYLGGSYFGNRPLAPSISPKKTVEGTTIGILCTIGVAVLWGNAAPIYQVVDYIILALIASAIGSAGDLIESQIKRWAGVKDSGQMMPGHGGALDRFDSIIFASSFAFLYAFFFMDCQYFEFF